MPISPNKKKNYVGWWKQLREWILQRADNRCEFCGVKNYSIRKNGSKVILTIAHLDHDETHGDPSRLAALCQACHNKWDGKYRALNRKRNADYKKSGQRYLFETRDLL